MKKEKLIRQVPNPKKFIVPVKMPDITVPVPEKVSVPLPDKKQNA